MDMIELSASSSMRWTLDPSRVAPMAGLERDGGTGPREGFPVTAPVTAMGYSGDRWGPNGFLNPQLADLTWGLNPVRIPLSANFIIK